MYNNLLKPATWYLFNFSNAQSTVRTIALWLTVALAIGFLTTFFAIDRAYRKKFVKIALTVAIVYTCAIIVTFFTFRFIENKESGEFVATLFVPITLLIISIAVSALMLMYVRNKATYIISGVSVGVMLVMTLVFMGIHYSSGKGAEMNWITNADVNSLGLYLSAAIFTALVIIVAFLVDKTPKGFSTKAISYAAVCIAMSFALSYLRIVKLPQGGAITIASLLPLMIYSYMFGTRKGIFAGAIYGILEALHDPYIIHPAQFILDYPLAFGCIGLTGMFAQNKSLQKVPQLQFALGAVVAGLCRFVMHYFSGVFAFGAFAPEGQSVYVYSLVYQAAYVLPDMAIAIAVGVFVFSSKSFVKMMRKYNGTLEVKAD